MRQIYQLTQVLERVIAAVVGLKGKGQSQEAIQITNQALTEHLKLDIDALLDMDADQMIEKLEEHAGMNHENLENAADLFYELGTIVAGEVNKDVESAQLYERALRIYRYIESEGTIYSIDRNHKIQEIEQRLSES
ncbi:MAG: hypothetical protein CL666_00895 [Balneola sp.]|nr:hypothetical protein [Balneola sp.]|tara:strand:- start:30093 stop:30500 length:408 start_codon:yes stop_codon:yes gene_type:complete